MSAGVNAQGENHGDSVRSCEAGAACANLCPCHAKYCPRCAFCGLHRHAVNLPPPNPLNKKSKRYPASLRLPGPPPLKPPQSRPCQHNCFAAAIMALCQHRAIIVPGPTGNGLAMEGCCASAASQYEGVGVAGHSEDHVVRVDFATSLCSPARSKLPDHHLSACLPQDHANSYLPTTNAHAYARTKQSRADNAGTQRPAALPRCRSYTAGSLAVGVECPLCVAAKEDELQLPPPLLTLLKPARTVLDSLSHFVQAPPLCWLVFQNTGTASERSLHLSLTNRSHSRRRVVICWLKTGGDSCRMDVCSRV